MRIALVHKSGIERGGVETYLDLVARGLRARGHELVRIEPTRAAPEASERAAELACAALARSAIDVVHAHRVEDPAWIAALARHFPVLWSIHDHRPFCPGANRLRRDGDACVRVAGPGCAMEGVRGRCAGLPRWPLATGRRVAAWSRTRAALVGRRPLVVASAFVRDVAVGQGIAARDVVVLPYPVEVPPEAEPSTPAGGAVLFVGRFVEPDKGLALLTDVLGRLPPTTRAVIAGEGPARPWLEARLAAGGLRERVEMVGWLDRAALAEHLNHAAMLVMTSAWPEPSGLAGLEALAHGRPVVATDVGGIGEWLADGVVGCRVPAGDSVTMADRIRALLGDRARREAMGRAGRAWVAAHRAPEAHLAALERLYAAVTVRSHGTPGS